MFINAKTCPPLMTHYSALAIPVIWWALMNLWWWIVLRGQKLHRRAKYETKLLIEIFCRKYKMTCNQHTLKPSGKIFPSAKKYIFLVQYQIALGDQRSLNLNSRSGKNKEHKGRLHKIKEIFLIQIKNTALPSQKQCPQLSYNPFGYQPPLRSPVGLIEQALF